MWGYVSIADAQPSIDEEFPTNVGELNESNYSNNLFQNAVNLSA